VPTCFVREQTLAATAVNVLDTAGHDLSMATQTGVSDVDHEHLPEHSPTDNLLACALAAKATRACKRH